MISPMAIALVPPTDTNGPPTNYHHLDILQIPVTQYTTKSITPSFPANTYPPISVELSIYPPTQIGFPGLLLPFPGL